MGCLETGSRCGRAKGRFKITVPVGDSEDGLRSIELCFSWKAVHGERSRCSQAFLIAGAQAVHAGGEPVAEMDFLELKQM